VTDELIETVARAITAEVRKAEEKVEGRSSFTVDECWEQYKPEARAALQAIEESGTHVVVPVEVTDDMLNEAQSRLCEITNPTYFNDYNQAEMFKAMLAARPKVTTNG
jgi:hypothetical protein